MDGGLEVTRQFLARVLFDDPELQRLWLNFPSHPLQGTLFVILSNWSFQFAHIVQFEISTSIWGKVTSSMFRTELYLISYKLYDSHKFWIASIYNNKSPTETLTKN